MKVNITVNGVSKESDVEPRTLLVHYLRELATDFHAYYNAHQFLVTDEAVRDARLTLMESDGMNPKATNNRCHGIIQFCDGPDRGAASAGFGSNPKAILGHSVLQQLDMVSKYFDETGLRSGGPTSLDDLYLTVLTPSARREKAPDASLNIAGSQATHLYVNRDKSAPITRNSIMQGLYQNALERLGRHVPASAAATLAQNTPAAVNLPTPSNAVSRAQALRIGAYLNQDYVR